jgi:hypothetical protein
MTIIVNPSTSATSGKVSSYAASFLGIKKISGIKALYQINNAPFMHSSFRLAIYGQSWGCF